MFVNMAVNKKKMLLAMIGGVVAGVAVTFITAVGSLSENLILQEISSFVMDMTLPFVIWLILTPNTNKVMIGRALHVLTGPVCVS